VFLASLEITHRIESILQTRKSVYETPPIALVHYVGYVYACSRLGRSNYRPAQVAQLAGAPPNEADVNSIREDLQTAGARLGATGKRVEGVALSREFIDRFVRERYGSTDAV
jgi:hypothetical protein